MKIKKIFSVLIMCAVLCTAFVGSVSAAVLEVDTSSSEFKADTWQNNESNGEIFPLSNIFLTGPVRVVPNDEQVRYSANIQVGAANMEGELTIADGTAINYITFPFKETVKINSISLKFNNAERRYFFNFYTSMDGQNWTEVTVTGNAEKVTLDPSYDDVGTAFGPSVSTYATIPSGFAADGEDINVLTLTLAQTAEAKYVRMACYGNDNATGMNEVGNPWFSFNSLKFEGDVAAAAPAAAEEPAAPVAEAAAPEAAAQPEAPAAPAPAQTATAPAPRTADPITLIALGSIISAAGVVIAKKRK